MTWAIVILLGRGSAGGGEPAGIVRRVASEEVTEMDTKPTHKKCPFCAEEILAEATKCKHCGSMLDGSTSPQNVRVTAVDPFAAYHTTIQGKTAGRITPVGYMGIGLGVLMIVVAGRSLSLARDGGQGAFMLGLLGVGAILASYLWARR